MIEAVVLEKRPELAKRLCEELADMGVKVFCPKDKVEVFDILANNSISLLILDAEASSPKKLASFDLLELIKFVANRETINVLIISGKLNDPCRKYADVVATPSKAVDIAKTVAHDIASQA